MFIALKDLFTLGNFSCHLSCNFGYVIFGQCLSWYASLGFFHAIMHNTFVAALFYCCSCCRMSNVVLCATLAFYNKNIAVRMLQGMLFTKPFLSNALCILLCIIPRLISARTLKKKWWLFLYQSSQERYLLSLYCTQVW